MELMKKHGFILQTSYRVVSAPGGRRVVVYLYDRQDDGGTFHRICRHCGFVPDNAPEYRIRHEPEFPGSEKEQSAYEFSGGIETPQGLILDVDNVRGRVDLEPTFWKGAQGERKPLGGKPY
jgi:hypothetical protein